MFFTIALKNEISKYNSNEISCYILRNPDERKQRRSKYMERYFKFGVWKTQYYNISSSLIDM